MLLIFYQYQMGYMSNFLVHPYIYITINLLTNVVFCSGAPTSSQADAATEPFTLNALSTGLISTHRLLAADTLAFALRAEQALEHEDKCREVYNRSIQSSTVGTSQSGAQPSRLVVL